MLIDRREFIESAIATAVAKDADFGVGAGQLGRVSSVFNAKRH